MIEAVTAGTFHVWPVQTIEEAIFLLTGSEAGERLKDGSYPKGSFNQAVRARLISYNQAMKSADQDERRRKKTRVDLSDEALV